MPSELGGERRQRSRGECLAEQLLADPAFTRAARWTHAEIVLEGGTGCTDAVILSVFEGSVTVADHYSNEAVRLCAPDGWQRLTAPGGLQRGFRHGYLLLEGDRVNGMRNWIALARLVDVVARAR